MTYRRRLSVFIAADSVMMIACIFLSQFLTGATIHVFTFSILLSIFSILISYHMLSFVFKLYKKAWEYASVGELIIIFKVVSFSLLITGIVQQAVIGQIHFRLLAVIWLLHLFMIGGSRFCWRIFRDHYLNKGANKKRTLIIGAGSAGTMVARQLLKSNDTDLLPVAFIDDDRKKHHLDILGLPVMGDIQELENTVKELNVEHVIIAIPSLSKRELNQIFLQCAKTKAKTQILPMLEDLVSGRITVNGFRDVQVEDLLGRKPVELNIESISEYITGKVILVSGAGGSIGSEICRQICQFRPSKLVLMGHGENSIHSIERELNEQFAELHINIETEIADLKDLEKIMFVMEQYQPDVVYHAAAHKHVPLMEKNPEEALKNNVIGTKNIAEAANWHRVKTFVMLSTDKAVNPTSVMGASKRLAEIVIQHMDRMSETKFVAVRFGNVLGSRGSVIPIFKKQIEKGGPVTVTHPEMERYFMTIPEASRLVIQAGALAKGGEIFVLDMGDPVKIVDLAKNLIKLSGYSTEEIPIKFTGIRKGEKLFEELLKPDEIHEHQVYPNIYIGKSSELNYREIEKLIHSYTNSEKEELRKQLLMLANEQTTAKYQAYMSM
ncbi:polysaccharide biosynthesis protein [Siminovitchia sediminis]|uniref:Polysaccharide biosynthesis protein n=1 Tax=Siminovitchia sediminis TaxID=1274353 RepID=A0ABW4KJV7_9BACI